MQTRFIASSKQAASFFSTLKASTIIKSTQGDQLFPRLLGSSAGRTADPAIHSTEDDMGPNSAVHSGEDAYKAMKDEDDNNNQTPLKNDKDPFVPSKAPLSSSQQLKSTAGNLPINPNNQQKRKNSTGGVGCLGTIDAWPEEKEDEVTWREQRKEQEKEDKEYFSHHKASPLSEIEVADTRKPVTQATDGSDARGEGVVLFREEQRLSAEETMRRATEMWREMAARGDPHSPHGRVLRALRGEDW